MSQAEQFDLVYTKWSSHLRRSVERNRRIVTVTRRGRWLVVGKDLTFDPNTLQQTMATRGPIGSGKYHLERIEPAKISG